MASIKVKLTGADDAVKNIRNWYIAKRQMIEDHVMGTAIDVQREAKKLVPVHMGGLKSSISLLDVALQGLRVEVGSRLNYAEAVEFGSEPHWPGDKKGLEFWVKKKLHVPDKYVEGVAFAVARSISKKGTQPQPFLHPAAEGERQKWKQGLIKILKS